MSAGLLSSGRAGGLGLEYLVGVDACTFWALNLG